MNIGGLVSEGGAKFNENGKELWLDGRLIDINTIMIGRGEGKELRRVSSLGFDYPSGKKTINILDMIELRSLLPHEKAQLVSEYKKQGRDIE